MLSCDFCDGQRSSLIVQLQSVSESPIRTVKCREDLLLFLNFSYERLFSSKLPQDVVSLLYFSNIRFKVTESPSITDTDSPKSPDEQTDFTQIKASGGLQSLKSSVVCN